jgi:hypothetical protein
MNKKLTNLPKPKKGIFLGQLKKPKEIVFKNRATSQRTRSLGGHR